MPGTERVHDLGSDPKGAAVVRPKFWHWRFGLVVSALALSSSAAPQAPPPNGLSMTAFREMLEQILRTNPEIVKDALVRAEAVEEARKAAEAKRAASRLVQQARSGTSSMPIIGSASAQTTIVQVIDYRCPFCQLMHPEMTKLLAQRPDVRVAFLVISILGEESEALARFALAAAEQGKFEAIHNALLAAPEPVQANDGSLRALANKAGMDWPRAQLAMKSIAVSERLQSMQRGWEGLHRPGTPLTIVHDEVFAGATKADELTRALAEKSGQARTAAVGPRESASGRPSSTLVR